jgi:hypothetical protein
VGSVTGDQHKAQPKAWAIADELIACGRASKPVPVRGYLCLRGENAGYYWVANDGERVIRGINIDSATVISDPAQSASHATSG